MAGKRNASNELTHDNWDDEYEHEDAGTFKRAPDEVIRNRVIKTARRRNPISSNNDNPKNVFSGFDGFKKPDTNQPKNSSPFAFASLITKPENISNSFGLFKNITSSKVSNTPSNTGSVPSLFKIPEVPSANNNKEKTDSSEKDTNYYAKLKGLNESVLDWIKTHVEKNPFIILTPVFEDYNKHLSKIEKENGSVKTISETSIGFKQTVSPNKSSTHSASIFGNLSSKSSDSNILSSTSLEEPKDATSIASSPSGTTTTSFSFGSNPKSASPSTTGFSFGSGTPFTFTNVSKVESPDNPSPAPEQKDTHIADEDEPPKVEFTPVVEDGNIFQKRCKVFIKKNNQFSDRGVGQLFLKPVEGSEKIQLIARADTNLGNLLLNFILNTSIPMQRMGKNNVMLVSIPTPECKPPPVPILLRVKTSEEADDLLKVLQKYRK